MNDSDSDLTARARRVADAIASSRLEGLELSPSTLADLAAYAEGHIDAEDLMAGGERGFRPDSNCT